MYERFYAPYLQLRCIFCDIQDRLAVDLDCTRLGKSDMHFLSRDDFDHIRQFNVFAFKDERKAFEGLDLGTAVIDDHSQHIRAPVLTRRQHHTASAVSALHGRCQPDIVIFIVCSVHIDPGMTRLKSIEKAFDGDTGVIDFLVRLLRLDPVSLLAAVYIDTKAHIVDKLMCFPFDVCCRKIDQIRIEKHFF